MSALTILFAILAVVASATLTWLLIDAFTAAGNDPSTFNKIWVRLVAFVTMIGAAWAAPELDKNAHPTLTSYWVLCTIPAIAVTLWSSIHYVIHTRRR